MRIQNPFRLGLLAGLGVLVALGIGTAIGQLAGIVTYVGAALFIALGLDPLITWLDKIGVKRWLAIVIVLVGVLGVFTGLVFAVVPVVVEQSARLYAQAQEYLTSLTMDEFVAEMQRMVPVEIFNVREATDAAVEFISNPENLTAIASGVLSVGANIAQGAFGALIVLILTLYFTSSLATMKRLVYQLVPASKRERFVDIAEQVATAVGRWVVGQVSLALVNGLLSFIFLSIIGSDYPALFAFIAFLFSLVPLVGTITGSIVIVAVQWMVNPTSTATVVAAAIYYLVYMQVEAYVLSPSIMNRAVKVPGVVVVIAALTGGTLLGILGALIAIPVAAAILIVVRQVFIPRQNTL